jgi:hypothetical protein
MVPRRRFLLLGGAAGALAVGGATGFAFTDRFRGWIRDTLEHALPGYSLEPAGLAQFAGEYYAKRKDHDALRVFAAAQGVIDAKWALPPKMAIDVQEEERQILTDFLVGSDFFDNYPDGPKTVTYRGLPEACNPFATF